jgi:hypothetical protein
MYYMRRHAIEEANGSKDLFTSRGVNCRRFDPVVSRHPCHEVHPLLRHVSWVFLPLFLFRTHGVKDDEVVLFEREMLALMVELFTIHRCNKTLKYVCSTKVGICLVYEQYSFLLREKGRDGIGSDV